MSQAADSFGPFMIDRERMWLLRDGVKVKLRYKAVQVLLILLEHAGTTLPYDELGTLAWKLRSVSTNTVMVTVHEIVLALGEDYAHYIQNFPRIGYRFEDPEHPVTKSSAENSGPRRICIVPTVLGDNTREQDKSYLASSIAFELATALHRFRHLRVIKAPPQAFSSLSLGEDEPYIVEGNLAGSGESLSIDIQLVSGRTPEVVWGQSYPLFDLQSVISRIASRIANAVKGDDELPVKLEETMTLRSEPKVDKETFDIYMRGLYHWNRPTEIDLFRAVEYFRYATSRQQNFAKAYGAMAHAYGLLGLGGFIPPQVAMSQAKVAAEKCISLFPDSSEGLAGLAAIDGYYSWKWQDAESKLRRALELSPRYETGHHLYAMGCLMPQKRFVEALQQITIAREINPGSPFILTCVGIVNFYARNYSGAMEGFEAALKFHPHYYLAHWHRSWVLLEWGHFDKAIEAMTKAFEGSNGSAQVLAALGQVFAAAGKIDRSREILNQLKKIGSERYVSPYDVALVHISLGDDREALALLRDAVAQRVPMLARLRIHPLFDRYHSNPEFLSLLQSVNLSPTPTVEAKPPLKTAERNRKSARPKRKR